MGQLIRVIARFVDSATQQPLSGEQYLVKLFDKDVADDDLLAEGRPDEDGRVDLLVDLGDASSWDSPGEDRPDLYFVLYQGDKERHRTAVLENVDFLSKDMVTGEQRSLTRDLGTIKV